MGNIVENAGKRAPKWYRVTKRIIYLVAGSSIVTGTLGRFGVSPDDQNLIIGWIIMVGEILNILLVEADEETGS